ncbi:RagB/SusD family nutrient uptake outer membrane protein [Maribellus maritimus]|uniref:RagB/SusD family nutrient uptake outer membrane protein n=1 Tax=Maribellus maritimus TaxID=2870838 RepID=UPI001EEB3A6A|nr:RagB/SusD family nutrient uptake outer membrane protein [Maribellus maritimus]MCG6189698.1 RagB/SusD family nutrient uptake outer membrane protein [Maribellus maritimus]
MKKIYLNTSFLFLIITVFTSCNDYLTKSPIDNPSVSVFLQSESELELAVIGAYNSLWYDFNYGLPMEQHLDLASDIGWSRAWGDFQLLGSGTLDPTNAVILEMWEHLYTGIQRCNYAIEGAANIETISDQSRIDQLLAESRVLRAYFYYQLVELFGDVPFYTTNLTLENSKIERTEKSQIVEFILSELEESSSILVAEYSDDSYLGRITKGVALALKARVALFNEKWTVAIDAAQRTMALNYELDEDYTQLFEKSGQINSNEIILKLSYLVGTIDHSSPRWCGSRMASGYSGLIPTQSMMDSYLCADGLNIHESPLYNPQKPFENRDPRLQYSTIVPGSIFHGYQYETHKDSLLCWNYNVSPPARVTNTDVTNPYASFSGYCWRKYATYEDANSLRHSETGIILIRYAEVLLTYAEAKIEANDIDQSVYDAINQIRERVGMPIIEGGKSQNELRSILRKERKIELAFEGLRLFDIRRWKIAEDVLNGPLYGRIPKGLLSSAPLIDENGTPDYSAVSNKDEMRIIENRVFDTNKNYLWPIPQFERDLNSDMKQNPGY